MGSKSQTTSTSNNSTTTPTNLAALQSIFDRVQGAASSPYTPYTGELTAGINQQQQTGINNINSGSNAAQPFYNSASGYATQAGAPISADQIQSYMNPYTQSVINATQANFNESNGQQQQQVKGNAALAGALGGDRQAVAQAETARQQKLAQDPVIANLQSQGYSQALGAAQADRSAAGSAANLFGSLGTGAQNAALQGANAQVGAGTLQQQTQQAGDTAQYQQYLQAQGFPYQQAQFLAQYGTPAALSQGSNTTGTGTQTAPGPNPFSQLLGLGTAALGAFSDERVKENIKQVGETYDGQPIYKFNYIGNPMTQIGLMAQDVEKDQPDAVGERDGIKTVNYDAATADAADRGHFASGGAVGAPFNFISDGPSFIPKGQPIQIQMPQSPSQQAMGSGSGATPGFDMAKSAGSFLGAAAKGFGNRSTPDYGQTSNIDIGGYSMPQFGNSVDVGGYSMPTIGFAGGGFVDTVNMIHGSIKKARGGVVGGGPLQGYADGGMTFDDRFGAAFPNQAERTDAEILAQDTPWRMPPHEAVDEWRKGVEQPNAAVLADVPPMNGAAQSAPAPATAANPMTRPALPPQITNPDATEQPEEPSSALAYDSASPMRMPAGAPREATAAGTMGGFNPFGLSDKARQAIIAGGLGMAASKSPFFLSAIGEGGLHGVKAYGDATTAERDAEDKKLQRQQNQQRIDMEAKRLVQSAEQFSKTQGLAERRQQFSEDKTPEGYRVKKGEEGYEPIPGGPADPETIRKVAEARTKPGAPIDDDTANFVADQVLAGDSRALIGFGRGAQGAENLIKVRQMVAQKARAQGLDPTDILNNVAIQSGNTATQRTFGTQTAKMAINATEAQGAIELGRVASAAVPRTDWVPVNKAIQAYQAGTSDPKLAKFGAANLAIINTYARAISPTGVPTVNDKQHAEHLLSTATGAEAYNAVLDQMNDEIKIAHAAPVKAKKELEDIRKGRTPDHTPAAPVASGAIPVQPKTVPQGSSYSPSRKQWRAPDGTIFSSDGSKI